MSKKSKNESSQLNKILVIISIIIVTIALYFLVAVPGAKKPPARGTIDHAKNYADIGGDFVLTDQDGNRFSSDMLKGKPSMIYFGFTFCPDICPMSLGKMTEVMNVLDKYQIDINPVFITIDPSRDDVNLMQEYMSNFHQKFIGLTGSPDDITKASHAYKVYFERAEETDQGKDDYLINHTSFIYLMDKNNRYIKHFDMSATAEEIIEFIRINFR